MSLEKTNDELANMSVEELAGYYNTVNEAKNAEITEAIESKSSKEEVAKLYNQYKKDTDAQMEKLNSVLVEQGLKIKKLKDGEAPSPASITTSRKSTRKSLEENLENLKGLKGALKDAKASEFTTSVSNPMTIKAAGDMSYAGGTATLGSVPLPFREAGVYDERRSTLGFLPYVETIGTDSNVISWVQKVNRENGADVVAETAGKPQSDFELQVTQAFILKYANYIKVSTEMLDDISFMQGEIDRELIGNTLEKVDKDCFVGTGANVIQGILVSANYTAYNAGQYAGTVGSANLVDVLITAMAQMSASFYRASRIFLNPSDVATLKLTKDKDHNYINRLMVTAEGLSLDGVPISESYHVTAGDFAVCDMSQIRMYVKEEIGLEFGLDGNDFTNNMRTILSEWRGILRVVDSKAIITGDIATAITALNA